MYEIHPITGRRTGLPLSAEANLPPLLDDSRTKHAYV